MTYTSLCNPMEKYQSIITREKELYAEQQCIAFLDWVGERKFESYCDGVRLWYHGNKPLSTKELYQLFLTHQNKQP